ncbi:FAD-dependent oxidoreductase [Acidimangrovimonas sediminis]|uniref:FAD-dependent oxidoreductase n=1 Tax=Albidovulum sediminis TaxID=3066345 RepID=A0ABT2NQM9_9RHOB|nr:FAD-dependent oxidoreductase [Defluviimonas sediminis]MCT8331241.1 FAD-dependent oxidoreductase [Defluviimonas sediminis]
MTTVVIGAGIIGTAIAHELGRRGRPVVLIDRDAPGMGASFGNAASIAVTEFMPASRPAIWRQIPGWLLDPEGPVRIRPAHMPRLIPWFLRFIAASRPARVRELEAAGAALCTRALDDTLALLRDTGLEGEITEQGCLSIYADEAEFRGDREHLDLLERFGLPHEVLDRQAIRALEPEIAEGICTAVLLPQNRSIRDPHRLVSALAERFAGLGGKILRGEVATFTRSDAIREVVLTDGRRIAADAVLISAGAHSAGDRARLSHADHVARDSPAPLAHLAGARLHGHADGERHPGRRNGGDGGPRRGAGLSSVEDHGQGCANRPSQPQVRRLHRMDGPQAGLARHCTHHLCLGPDPGRFLRNRPRSSRADLRRDDGAPDRGPRDRGETADRPVSLSYQPVLRRNE